LDLPRLVRSSAGFHDWALSGRIETSHNDPVISRLAEWLGIIRFEPASYSRGCTPIL
jgi:hypothetical protein